MHAPGPIEREPVDALDARLDERAVVFECSGDELVGVLACTGAASRRGVLIIVGGPQYRVGSHRQFTLLARRLAAEGVPTFRFDYRGMGDSGGLPRTFEAIDSDIASAVSTFLRLLPTLREIVLWGLCDAASAALMYGVLDARIKGLVALNPWVRSDETLAKSRVKYYYPRRLLQRDFWTKLLTGNVGVKPALVAFVANLRQAGRRETKSQDHFITRMRRGLRDFSGPVLLILSGNDLTAKEFHEAASADPIWTLSLKRPNVEHVHLPDADHTFSDSESRGAVEYHTLRWLNSW